MSRKLSEVTRTGVALLMAAAFSVGCAASAPPVGDEEGEGGTGGAASGGKPGGPGSGSGGKKAGGAGGSNGGGGSSSSSGGTPAGGGGGGEPGAGGSSGDAAIPDPQTPDAGDQVPGVWRYQRQVTLDTSPAGAGIATTLENYPVPVQLTKDNFDFGQAKADGSDVRFTKADGSPLPHEIEVWDKANQQAALWVKTTVMGGSAAQTLIMKWGNPSAPATADGKAVFPAAEKWVAAWHLSDDAGPTQDGYKDATGVNHGTGHNMEKGATRPGRMGLATNLDHLKKQGVKVVENRKNFDLAKDITFEIWCFVRSFGYDKGYESYMTKGDESWRYMRSGKTRITEICSDGQNPSCVFSKSSIEFGKWYHFAGVHQGGRAVRLYINGKREGQGNAGSDHGSFGDHAVTLGFSLHKGVEQRFMDMIIDEARFIGDAKSDDWIKLDYESLREGSTFVKLGAVTTAP